jgi:hypothetical protein
MTFNTFINNKLISNELLNDMNRKNERRKTPIVGKNGRQSSNLKGLTSVPTHSCLNGVNNLRPKCEQTFRVIVSNPNNDSALNSEKQLWNQIKEYRHQKVLMSSLLNNK